jgi:allantoinase
MRVGYWRFKALFDRMNIIPTLSINANVCERYERAAASARDAGWEFMGHSYVQMPTHALENEEENMVRSLDVCEKFTGKRPVGWLGPGLTETYASPDLMTKHGIKYTGDFVFDDEPCVLSTDNGPLVTLPYTVELNDIPMMIVQHHESSYFKTRIIDQFDRLYAESGERVKFLSSPSIPISAAFRTASGISRKPLNTWQASRAWNSGPESRFMTGLPLSRT